ncbi:hypothetical protein KC331_g38 [Hortaea werneckii]|nr:hypothetical protein KC331_g38 [Hortaea werneckii]
MARVLDHRQCYAVRLQPDRCILMANGAHPRKGKHVSSHPARPSSNSAGDLTNSGRIIFGSTFRVLYLNESSGIFNQNQLATGLGVRQRIFGYDFQVSIFVSYSLVPLRSASSEQ